MSFDTTVNSNFQELEYQKFVQINNETSYPAVSVLRTDYYGLSSISIYPKTAVLTYETNPVGSLSASPVYTYTAGFGAVTSNSFTRVADTSAYSSGDLVSNSTTAGSVVPLSFVDAVRSAGGVSRAERIRLRKTGTSITNASFRVHLYTSTPTVTGGDNSALATPISGYLGAFDVVMDRFFTDGAVGTGLPIMGSSMTFTVPLNTTLFGLVEARAAYTPVSSEVFTATLELYRF